MSLPLIGLTTSRFKNSGGTMQVATAEAYVQAVLRAGGLPVLIPPLPLERRGVSEDAFQELLARLQGILLTGGGDVDPSRYDGLSHERIYGIDSDRDELEIRLVQSAVERRQPFLGICRGLQLIYVALGGSLYSDIAAQHPQAIKHDHFPGIPRDYLAHRVRVEDHTLLKTILETESGATSGASSLEVNSLHHQGVQVVSNRLRATAYSPDGLVEAVEMPDHPFGLAVQWHPEWLQDHEPMRALFRAFVSASANYKTGAGTAAAATADAAHPAPLPPHPSP